MADEKDTTPKKPVRKRGRAASPPAGAGGIHDLAQTAAQQAESMKTAETARPDEVSPSASEPVVVVTPGVDGATDEKSSDQEIKKSGLTSGNPEIKKEEPEAEEGTEDPPEEPFDYLEASYGGITAPEEDFVKGSTQLPKYVWKALKAAAVMHQVPMQQLLRDIILGTAPSLPAIAPAIERKFYRMAKEGKLKN